VSYGPQPGYYPPPYGQYPPPRPSTAFAYVSAGLFLICGLLALLTAIVGWSGSSANPDLMAAVVGIAFTEDVTGNIDFGISMGMTVACTTITFALLLFARLDFVRWILGFVGALVTVYFVYAMIWLVSNDAGEVVAMPLVSFLLWTAATVVVLIPQTGRAMRGYQRRLGYPQHHQQPYPQQQYQRPPGY
jgi:hypothetical protein